MATKEARTEVTMIRWTKSEKKAAENKARAKGLTLSAWLRMLAMTAVALAMVSGCGGDPDAYRFRSEGMWASTEGVLSCVGASVTTDGAGSDPEAERAICHWLCAEVDGVTYPEVLLGFVRHGGESEWHLESEYFSRPGDCSN